MYSSLSLNSNRDKSYSKKPDFHKDIIIPVIYSNDNYEFIKNNNYQPIPDRKVLSAKLNRVQSIVETIVSKKNIEVTKKQPMYQHRLAKPKIQYKRKSLQTFTVQKPDTMMMDIDQKLNQKAVMYQQQTAYAQQKIKQARDKVKYARNDKQQKQSEEINFYLTQLVPKRKPRIFSSHQIYIATSLPVDKKIQGYVEEHEKIQQRRQLRNKREVKTQTQMRVKQIKNRPKTANQTKHKKKQGRSGKEFQYNPSQILFRSNSLMNTRLGRFEEGIQERQNIKKSMKNNIQKQKLKKLFNRIESNCLLSTLTKSNIVNEMNKLAMVWKTQKQFLNTPQTRSVMQITEDTLQVLKSRRKKQGQIAKLDENYMEQSKIVQKPQYF